MKAAVSRYELQEREHLFHTVFENSPDAIFIEDLKGNVLDVIILIPAYYVKRHSAKLLFDTGHGQAQAVH